MKAKETYLIVIIPTKNRPENLERALILVKDQTLLPDMVIIINDSKKEYEHNITKIKANSYT